MTYEKINKILFEISSLLQKKTDIIEFSKLVSNFNAELNLILKKYHDSTAHQENMRPQVMYYQNLFQDLITASLNDQYLEDIKDSLRLKIKNRVALISDEFTCKSDQQKTYIEQVKPVLEKNLKKWLAKHGQDLDEDKI